MSVKSLNCSSFNKIKISFQYSNKILLNNNFPIKIQETATLHMNFQIICDKLETKLTPKFSPRVVSQNCIKLSNSFILPFGNHKICLNTQGRQSYRGKQKETFLKHKLQLNNSENSIHKFSDLMRKSPTQHRFCESEFCGLTGWDCSRNEKVLDG